MIVIHRVVIPTFLVTHVSTSLLPVKSDDAVRTAGSGLFHFISPHVTYTPSNSTHRSRPETTLYASNDAPFRIPFFLRQIYKPYTTQHNSIAYLAT